MKILFLTLISWLFLISSSISYAALEQFYTKTGQLFVSVDGAGSNVASHTIEVEKPNDTATVAAAFVMASGLQYSKNAITDGGITINGTPISWDVNIYINHFNNVRADVTSIVKPIVDAASAGRTSFIFTENKTDQIDGETLVVVFDDPAQTQSKTVALFFGGQNSTGDNFTITLASPVDPTAPGATADFGLGIGYGYQHPQALDSQFSEVNVNGSRLTSSAGGQDDGSDDNGTLVTVGGLDDSNANPVDPNAPPNGDSRIDDELYSLLPFITSTDTNIQIDTINPSNDDDIYFSYLVISGAAVVGEGIILAPPTASLNTGVHHTVVATVVDNSGSPISGATVTFNIVSGPNAGQTFSTTTDINGQARYSYSSTSTGTDQIRASSPVVASNSNIVTVTWLGVPPAPVEPTPTNIPVLSPLGLFVLVGGLLWFGRRRLK